MREPLILFSAPMVRDARTPVQSAAPSAPGPNLLSQPIGLDPLAIAAKEEIPPSDSDSRQDDKGAKRTPTREEQRARPRGNNLRTKEVQHA